MKQNGGIFTRMFPLGREWAAHCLLDNRNLLGKGPSHHCCLLVVVTVLCLRLRNGHRKHCQLAA